MNYEKIYNDFIADRKAKEANLIESGEYFEKHHTVPKSMDGSDDAENLIALTAGDHYFAHLCLAKAYGGRNLWAAVWAMSKLKTNKHKRSYHVPRHFVNAARKKALGENNPFKAYIRYGDENPAKDSNARAKISKEMLRVWESEERMDAHLKHMHKYWRENKESRCGENHYMADPVKREAAVAKGVVKLSGDNHYTRRDPEKYTGKNHRNATAVINLDTGEVYSTQRIAAEASGANQGKISEVCNGKRKTAGGYRWAFADEADQAA